VDSCQVFEHPGSLMYRPKVSPSKAADSKPLRVVIAGGGTGGHLFPGVALAEQVRARGGEVLFVGTKNGIEARVLPEEGWDLRLVEVVGIKGRGATGLVKGAMRLPAAWLQSRRILREFRPDVVVGVGGYASGPIVATAAMMRIPSAILEQNSIPGITNRILGKLVRRIFGTFPDERGFFPARKLVLTGNPIRAELLDRLQGAASPDAHLGEVVSNEAHASNGNGKEPRRLFVFGGSQGARAINRAVVAALPAMLESLPGLEVWHQTGRSELEEVREGYASAGLTEPQARVVPFIRDMAGPYQWCDLVLCRAGATSLAELAAVGCPALLVPFPHATDNHQEHNGRALVEAGAARMLLESSLDATRLTEAVVELMADRARLDRMREAMLGCARPDAAAEIYDALVRLGAA
jgi:UDP-N-acetylglucosamine--N-acetylmuramyl-(pentapeptide) pyrophosphoryl-undecaprenol N-acetylglucosamine transferase